MTERRKRTLGLRKEVVERSTRRKTRPAGPNVPAWKAAGVAPIGPDPEPVEESEDVSTELDDDS